VIIQTCKLCLAFEQNTKKEVKHKAKSYCKKTFNTPECWSSGNHYFLELFSSPIQLLRLCFLRNQPLKT